MDDVSDRAEGGPSVRAIVRARLAEGLLLLSLLMAGLAMFRGFDPFLQLMIATVLGCLHLVVKRKMTQKPFAYLSW